MLSRQVVNRIHESNAKRITFDKTQTDEANLNFKKHKMSQHLIICNKEPLLTNVNESSLTDEDANKYKEYWKSM